jgi:hypothetical protein
MMVGVQAGRIRSQTYQIQSRRLDREAANSISMPADFLQGSAQLTLVLSEVKCPVVTLTPTTPKRPA